MNTIVFSKDRPFQLYSFLESYKKYVSADVPVNIIVQFFASNPSYLDGYMKLNDIFDDVTFIDENQYGFETTFRVLINEFDPNSRMSMEVDDIVYYRPVNFSRIIQSADKIEAKYGRLCVSMDVDIFNIGNFDTINNITKMAVIDRRYKMTTPIQEMCLKYPFGVNGAIYKVSDILNMLKEFNFRNPIELEINGTKSNTFNRFNFILSSTEEVCIYAHFNNEWKRYSETFTNESLHKLFTEGKVIDWDGVNVSNLTRDMRWFNGENIGRFPIFPWEINPIYHEEIITKHLKNI